MRQIFKNLILGYLSSGKTLIVRFLASLVTPTPLIMALGMHLNHLQCHVMTQLRRLVLCPSHPMITAPNRTLEFYRVRHPDVGSLDPWDLVTGAGDVVAPDHVLVLQLLELHSHEVIKKNQHEIPWLLPA